MTINFFDWTDEQWKAYNQQTVEIPLHRLETFCSAIELLAKGSRLNKKERQLWQNRLDKIYHPTYVKAIEEAFDKIK